MVIYQQESLVWEGGKGREGKVLDLVHLEEEEGEEIQGEGEKGILEVEEGIHQVVVEA